MKINLASPDDSDITFKVSRFPDGQQDVTLTGFNNGGIEGLFSLSNEPITILSRFNGFRDLELIIAATHAARRMFCGTIDLVIPYLLGARSDRQFVEGGTSYLVDVIAPILNSQGFESITVMDVHSDVAAACIKNLKESSVGRFGLVKWALGKMYPKTKETSVLDNLILISPDAGALKKTYKLVEALGCNTEVIVCSKSRDTEGKLSKTVVPFKEFQDKNYLIVDDICSRGNTFINIAKEIKPYMGKKASINLIVTHYEGTANLGSLLVSGIDKIFTTNSIVDLPQTVNFQQLNIF